MIQLLNKPRLKRFFLQLFSVPKQVVAPPVRKTTGIAGCVTSSAIKET